VGKEYVENITSIKGRTTSLKNFCKQNGFIDVGIAKVALLEKEYNNYQQWIDNSFHGTMSYLEKFSQRQNIKEILPEAKSVIVTATNYYTPIQHPSILSENEGKISRYAWGEDYHFSVKDRLVLTENFLKELSKDSISKSYVDTGPILEKAWAVRAGLGWQGKHSNVISRNHGSWFFIGIILSSLEFEYDSPVKDMCGSCTACIEACPTNAIVDPYIVDGTKCISYWTIETKPDIPIPKEIAKNLDTWAFGCDRCQDVCPWNRFQKETTETIFSPRENQTTLTFQEVANLTDDEFRIRFNRSPIKRTKLAGLKRNFTALQSGSDSKIKL